MNNLSDKQIKGLLNSIELGFTDCACGRYSCKECCFSYRNNIFNSACGELNENQIRLIAYMELGGIRGLSK